MKALGKDEREQIFRLFLKDEKLRFSEIEKDLKIRSNMVTYHLEQMQKKGLIEKKGFHYSLTRKAEQYIPIIPNLQGEKMSPLPVILVAVVKDDKILLIKRSNRPYKGYWCMIGGKMLLEESFEEASARVVKQKSGLDAKYDQMCGVMHERVWGGVDVKHSFILFLTKMSADDQKTMPGEYGELRWFLLKELGKEKIIPSDYWLIKHKLGSKIDVKSAAMTDNENNLEDFKIIH
ncbi:NUDIX domain-containing protein [Candidatus Woesearchaeota archaeon]|nr:NUDIX domain-containing protein [Candidatus Woesearchaeota archaeon]